MRGARTDDRYADINADINIIYIIELELMRRAGQIPTVLPAEVQLVGAYSGGGKLLPDLGKSRAYTLVQSGHFFLSSFLRAYSSAQEGDVLVLQIFLETPYIFGAIFSAAWYEGTVYLNPDISTFQKVDSFVCFAKEGLEGECFHTVARDHDSICPTRMCKCR
eukprot:SAG31_NODE_2902_length_4931_cov_3.338369_5_plen_163_part_00